MTPERFHQIVEAYGADPRRWPQQERAAAQAWAQSHRAEADALLAEAAGVDAWLAADKVEPPDAALQSASLEQRAGAAAGGAAAAPMVVGRGGRGRRAAGRRGRRFCRVVLRADGNGAAGAAAHESSYLTSSFGGSSADWSGE